MSKKNILAIVRGTGEFDRDYCLVFCDETGPDIHLQPFIDNHQVGYTTLYSDDLVEPFCQNEWESITGIVLAPGEWCPIEVRELKQ